MNGQIKIGIAGIKGYTGQALASLVTQHPHLMLSGILVKTADKDPFVVSSLRLNNIPAYTTDALINAQDAIDVLLLATPPDASIEIVTALQVTQIRLIDLSGAFRLSCDALSQWYGGLTHNIPALMQGAPYGLSPWGCARKPDENVIANPGCYATCALMSLIPLLQQDVISHDNIIIDAKSGISGAGRKTNPDLMFCEMVENFFPYKIGKHQHLPEIKKALLHYTNKACDITFVTNMLPIKSGIAMSVYTDANSGFHSDKEIANTLNDVYSSAYKDYPLIQCGEINAGNSDHDKFLLSLKNVVGTPNMHIAYFVDNGKIMLFCTIDNLLKGAASQAIENVNALYQWPLDTGLANAGAIQ